MKYSVVTFTKTDDTVSSFNVLRFEGKNELNAHLKESGIKESQYSDLGCVESKDGDFLIIFKGEPIVPVFQSAFTVPR